MNPVRPEKRVFRKAKKEHRCDWCGGAIFPGEEYVFMEFMLSRPVVRKMHRDCFEAAAKDPAVRQGRYHLYGQIRECTVEGSRAR